MEDPKILVYIAFIAISLIGSYLRNQSKKKAEAKEMEYETVSKPKEEPVQRREPEKLKKAERLQSSFEKREMSKPEVPTRTVESKKSKALVAESHDEEEHIMDDFDARKAIIYSEILKPPYL